MMLLADHEMGMRMRIPATMKMMPEKIMTLALAVSSSTQLVHLPPVTASRVPRMARTMATTTMARAACRSCGRASMESYTLHCICPVLCTTQLIHSPSQMICATTMLFPTKAVSRHMGNNIVTAQIIWEGLWMNCVVQSTGQMQCKVYDSMLALPQDLQAARALLVVAIILAVLGLMVAIVGAQCTRCVEDESTKAKITIVSGVIFLLSGVLTLIPVCWSANTIIRDFYNPLVIEAQKRELGTSLYVGWAASALLLLGGGLLCCSCPPKDDRYPTSKVAYSAPRSAVTSYDKRNYV
uniref:Claudin 3 n=1 Tax=Junco hyemalis TaxID=40217 RepID=A0A8C5NIC6_JUNHY